MEMSKYHNNHIATAGIKLFTTGFIAIPEDIYAALPFIVWIYTKFTNKLSAYSSLNNPRKALLYWLGLLQYSAKEVSRR